MRKLFKTFKIFVNFGSRSPRIPEDIDTFQIVLIDKVKIKTLHQDGNKMPKINKFNYSFEDPIALTLFDKKVQYKKK